MGVSCYNAYVSLGDVLYFTVQFLYLAEIPNSYRFLRSRILFKAENNAGLLTSHSGKISSSPSSIPWISSPHCQQFSWNGRRSWWQRGWFVRSSDRRQGAQALHEEAWLWCPSPRLFSKCARRRCDITKPNCHCRGPTVHRRNDGEYDGHLGCVGPGRRCAGEEPRQYC